MKRRHDTQYNDTQHKGPIYEHMRQWALQNYIIMQCFIIMSVAFYFFVIPSVIMLSVVMLSVIKCCYAECHGAEETILDDPL